MIHPLFIKNLSKTLCLTFLLGSSLHTLHAQLELDEGAVDQQIRSAVMKGPIAHSKKDQKKINKKSLQLALHNAQKSSPVRSLQAEASPRMLMSTTLSAAAETEIEVETETTTSTSTNGCWSGFTQCLKKSATTAEVFLEKFFELYDVTKETINETLVWSEYIALAFNNKDLAAQIQTLQEKGGDYAEKAELYLQMAKNGGTLLTEVSDVLSHIKLPNEGIVSELKTKLPTLISLASALDNGSYFRKNEKNQLAFYLKNENEAPTLLLSLDTQWFDVVSTDFSANTATTALGLNDEERAIFSAWKANFNAASLGLTADIKSGLVSLANIFAQMTTVDLDTETGTLLFYPLSHKEKSDKALVFSFTFPGFSSSWTPVTAVVEAPEDDSISEPEEATIAAEEDTSSESQRSTTLSVVDVDTEEITQGKRSTASTPVETAQGNVSDEETAV